MEIHVMTSESQASMAFKLRPNGNEQNFNELNLEGLCNFYQETEISHGFTRVFPKWRVSKKKKNVVKIERTHYDEGCICLQIQGRPVGCGSAWTTSRIFYTYST